MHTTNHTHVRIIVSTFIFLLISGTLLFKYIEPFTWIQAFYFTVTTMTTVGYGDLIPSSDLSRLAVALYILVSVTLYLSLATYFGAAYLQRHEARIEKRQDKNMQ